MPEVWSFTASVSTWTMSRGSRFSLPSTVLASPTATRSSPGSPMRAQTWPSLRSRMMLPASLAETLPMTATSAPSSYLLASDVTSRVGHGQILDDGGGRARPGLLRTGNRAAGVALGREGRRQAKPPDDQFADIRGRVNFITASMETVEAQPTRPYGGVRARVHLLFLNGGRGSLFGRGTANFRTVGALHLGVRPHADRSGRFRGMPGEAEISEESRYENASIPHCRRSRGRTGDGVAGGLYVSHHRAPPAPAAAPRPSLCRRPHGALRSMGGRDPAPVVVPKSSYDDDETVVVEPDSTATVRPRSIG